MRSPQLFCTTVSSISWTTSSLFRVELPDKAARPRPGPCRNRPPPRSSRSRLWAPRWRPFSETGSYSASSAHDDPGIGEKRHIQHCHEYHQGFDQFGRQKAVEKLQKYVGTLADASDRADKSKQYQKIARYFLGPAQRAVHYIARKELHKNDNQ